MGTFSIRELLFIVPGCLLYLAGPVCLVGSILGIIAFFKVRRLEKEARERRRQDGRYA